jgi:nitroreductase
MPANMIPYNLPPQEESDQLARSAAIFEKLRTRRSCRDFSPRPVPESLLIQLLEAANTAPSGANRKPWRFVIVNDPEIKRRIRYAAEKEEEENYDRRFPPEWLDALEPIGTDKNKPFLEIAPWLVVIFRVDWEEVDGKRIKNYYVPESVGLAAGFFFAACHMVGLATLAHTPNPMNFLREILQRPVNEKPYLLVPVGYPADDCRVPDLPKKPLDQVLHVFADKT